MSALTGILASTLAHDVEFMVDKYVIKANNSIVKKKKKVQELEGQALENEFKRAIKQQTSVYFLCAAVLSRPYDTPKYVPKALAALSKHSYERTAPFTVREAVKFCCREYKRTHMTDNWEMHKQQFTREQLEALEDVVSTPHYYA
jgi:proteasome activator subunit 4